MKKMFFPIFWFVVYFAVAVYAFTFVAFGVSIALYDVGGRDNMVSALLSDFGYTAIAAFTFVAFVWQVIELIKAYKAYKLERTDNAL